jgi:hypothetical protein
VRSNLEAVLSASGYAPRVADFHNILLAAYDLDELDASVAVEIHLGDILEITKIQLECFDVGILAGDGEGFYFFCLFFGGFQGLGIDDVVFGGQGEYVFFEIGEC